MKEEIQGIKETLDSHERLIKQAIECAEITAKNHGDLAKSVLVVVELHRDFVGAGRVIRNLTFIVATFASAFAYFKWIHNIIF